LSYLIDTNVLSELRRKAPDAGVVAWFAQRPASTLFLSVLTLGEIRKGIEGLADASRRLALSDWLEAELPAFFTGHLLPVDAAVADRWGRLLATAGRPVPAIDSLLAATALHHDLTLVTRNVRDFTGFGLQLINPWSE
jgi:predicted nucleic acid-binding protein